MFSRMPSQSPMREREESRHVSARTLVIASAASFVAAVVTSQFSLVGTPIAAALTPVIVALVSELLHRPTEVVVRRVTTDRPAVLPDAAGAGAPPPPDADALPERVPDEPANERERKEPVTVYRPARSRRRIAVGAVALTAVLAFAIAAVALTVPELITGQSIGKGDNKTSLVPLHKAKKKQATPSTPQAAPPQQGTSTTPAPQKTTTTPTVTEPAPSATTTQPLPKP
jgi:hypothetical protein